MHHFAHYQTDNCEYGYETSLHLAAKERLLLAKEMTIPLVSIELPNRTEILSKSRKIHIDKVELEKRFGDIIPDIVVYAGRKRLYIEIYVTHPIDDIKLEKIRKQNVSTLEINLSKIDQNITIQELDNLLLTDCPEKVWKYNAHSEGYLDEFKRVSKERPIISRGSGRYVDDCPIRARKWKGKYKVRYDAEYDDDCMNCEYYIQTVTKGDKSIILCSGEERISTIKDFDKPKEQRIKDSNERLERDRFERFENGLCPDCGNELILRKYGTFIGCKSYPRCKYTVKISSASGLAIYEPRFGSEIKCSIPYAVCCRR